MNQMLRNYIAVEGVEAALKVARTLIEQDYQVMVQLDDCDIYIVSYESNDDHLGDNVFASLSRNEIDIINEYREDKNYEKAKKFLEKYEERYWKEEDDDDSYDEDNDSYDEDDDYEDGEDDDNEDDVENDEDEDWYR